MIFNNKKLSIKEIINKFKLPIIIILSIVLLIIIIFIINHKNKITYFLDLEGNENITIYQGSEYIEPGYNAYDNKNNNHHDKVKIDSNLETSIIGEYQITYTLQDITKIRNVSVIEKPKGATYIHLIGNEVIYLKLNEEYIEPGYIVIDTIDSNLTKQVSVHDNINNKEAGVYKVTYTVTNSSDITTTTSRKIIVMDSNTSISLDNTEYTNKDVGINIHIVDNYFDYIVLPNNEKITDKDYVYKVSENGTYKFIIYTKKGSPTEESITVSNINKTIPTGSCTGYSENGKSYITVNAKDDIGISKYTIDNVSSTSNNITINKELTKANVTVYDKAGNSTNISCNINKKTTNTTKNIGKMEIHFINSSQPDDAILIRTENKNIFIDGGSHYAQKDVLKYLHEVGIKHIDVMIGSHLHSDHIQTQGYIINDGITVDKIYYPDDIFTCVSRKTCEEKDRKYILDAINKNNIPVTILKPLDTITVGDIKYLF